VQVLIGDALDGIDQNHAHMTSVDALQGPQDTDLFELLPDAALAADAGCIDEEIALAAMFEDRIHRVAGGAGRGVHNDPLRSQQMIDQS